MSLSSIALVRTRRAALFGTTFSLAGFLLAGAAWAEDAVAASTTAADSMTGAATPQVEEITVTARYRSESAQKVPIGITTLPAAQLAKQGAFTLKQVVQQLPSLNIQGFSGRNQTITIRGIGTNAGGTNDGLEQGVGIYVDGVYRPRTGSVITDLIDVDSIQLLRGPQGTLFGKNTVAGAIDIKTKEPSFTPSAEAELSYGNYDALRGYVALDTPINDKVAVRVSYLRDQRDGLIYNTTYKKHWDGLDNNAARVDVLFKPSDDFKFRLIGDYSVQKGDVGFESVSAILPTTLANGTRVRGFTQRAADVGYVPIPIDPFARDVDINSSQYDKMPSWGLEGRADWDVGPATITSITAYRNWKWIANYDGDQTGADVVPESIVDTKQQQFSQELRAASSGEHVIDYTGGLYFFWQKDDDLQLTSYGSDASAWLTTANTPTAAVSTLPAAALNGLEAYAHVVPVTYSYAAYGQATWNVSPVFRITGGLRFTYEHKTGSYDAYGAGDIAPITSFATNEQALVTAERAAFTPTGSYFVSKDTKNVSGTLIAAYDIDSNVHAYASYSRGYKSPGINLVAQANGVNVFVKPETVDDYEVGVKSRFLGGKAEVNIDLFWMADANYQANFVNTAVTPIVSYITNVGNLRSRGVELDSRFNPLDGLALSVAGTYDDAVYTKYHDAPAPYLQSYLGVVDLSGRPASGAPKWSATSSAEYTQHAGSIDLYGGGDVSYRSGFYAAVNDDPFSWVPGYTLFGLHAGVRKPDGRWDLSLWVRNLTNKNYYNTKAVSSTFGVVLAALGDPRMFGFTLRGRI